jgi:hypothetical protein
MGIKGRGWGGRGGVGRRGGKGEGGEGGRWEDGKEVRDGGEVGDGEVGDGEEKAGWGGVVRERGWEGGMGMGKRWGNVRRCKMVDVGDVGGWGGGEMDGMGGEGRIVERRGR